jgi:hypothetical protein
MSSPPLSPVDSNDGSADFKTPPPFPLASTLPRVGVPSVPPPSTSSFSPLFSLPPPVAAESELQRREERDASRSVDDTDNSSDADEVFLTQAAVDAAVAKAETGRRRVMEAVLRNAVLELQAHENRLRAEQAREAQLIDSIQRSREAVGTPLPSLPVPPLPSSLPLFSSLLIPPPVAARRVNFDPLSAHHPRGESIMLQRQREHMEALPRAAPLSLAPLSPPSSAPPPPFPTSSASSSPPPPPPPSSSSSSPSSYRHRPRPPDRFTGESEATNATIERWLMAANVYIRNSRCAPSEVMDIAEELFGGTAVEWIMDKKEEAITAGRVMTWDVLQVMLIEHFGRARGAAVMEAEWEVLKMGARNADGTETGGKATRKVEDYTRLFKLYMRHLTAHSASTTDLLIIQRYVAGIREGYPSLYAEMKGNLTVLKYSTLALAIEGAELAEAAFTVRGVNKQHSGSSSHPHSSHGGSRSSSQANNVEVGSDEEETPGAPPPPRQRRSNRTAGRIYGFNFRVKPKEFGRHPLTIEQAKMLFEEKRCYECYGQHADLGKCGKKMTVAPKSLK